jgi:hypothetical protein
MATSSPMFPPPMLMFQFEIIYHLLKVLEGISLKLNYVQQIENIVLRPKWESSQKANITKTR